MQPHSPVKKPRTSRGILWKSLFSIFLAFVGTQLTRCNLVRDKLAPTDISALMSKIDALDERLTAEINANQQLDSYLKQQEGYLAEVEAQYLKAALVGQTQIAADLKNSVTSTKDHISELANTLQIRSTALDKAASTLRNVKPLSANPQK